MAILLYKFCLYGCLGLLLEVFFTGFHSLYVKNWRLTSQTYLWMLPIYATAALLLEVVGQGLCGIDGISDWPRWAHSLVHALAYVPIIYAVEFSSGLFLEKVVGRCPWHYGQTRWGIMGLVRLDYAPYWFGAALFFDLISGWMDHVLRSIVTVL